MTQGGGQPDSGVDTPDTTYRVILNGNGVAVTPSEISVTYDDVYSGLPTLTREGYTFKGWFIGNLEIKDGDTVTITSNAEAVAKWEANTYEVTFDANGGRFSSVEFTTVGEEEYTIPETGTYKLEVWGAQGGNANSTYIGGYGAYSVGELDLDKGVQLYVNVGGKGSSTSAVNTTIEGGYNGGGVSDTMWSASTGATQLRTSGGGATHIAKSSGKLSSLDIDANGSWSNNELNNIYIVASGGGGGVYFVNGSYTAYCYGGSGGGISGSQGECTGNLVSQLASFINANQTRAGESDNSDGYTSINAGTGHGGNQYSGGGSGYYGGAGGFIGTGGGSSYIGNTILTNKLMYCYNCEESNDEGTKTMTTTNVSETPTSNYSKSGNGAAIISKVTVKKNTLFGSSYNILSTPTRDGYTFLGWYTEEFGGEKIEDATLFEDVNDNVLYAHWIKQEFAYNGGSQEFIAPHSGYYKLEVWGAQGGSANATYIGGYGAYSTGTIYLDGGEKLYINVGEQGDVTSNNSISLDNSYNGGGASNTCWTSASNATQIRTSGGGATHISKNIGELNSLDKNSDGNWSTDELNNLYIVASGGGGGVYFVYNSSNEYCIGGSGGGISGSQGTCSGSLTSYLTSFVNADQTNCGESNYDGATSSGSIGIGGAKYSGGGSGFYGGAGGYVGTGGGSSYIGNASLTNKVMYCYNCEESTAEGTKTISTTNVSETPTANYAKKGNGYARITLVSES